MRTPIRRERTTVSTHCTSSFAILFALHSLSKKDADLAVLANVIEEFQQQKTLSSVTTNAVTQRLHSVEKELQDTRMSHEVRSVMPVVLCPQVDSHSYIRELFINL